MSQLIFCIFSSSPLEAATNSSKELVLAADEWCPYNCIPNSKKPGYMVEIAREVFKDRKVIYKLRPWKRAMSMAQQNQIDGIIGAVDSESKGLFMPSNEQGILDGHYFAKKNVKWKITKISDIKKYNLKLGIVAGYGYADEVDQFIKKNPKHIYSSYGAKAMPKLIQLLKMGRINLLTDDKSVFWYKVKELNVDSKIFKSVGRPGSNIAAKKLYISFYDKKNAKLLSDGMNKIRKSGKLEKILEKYNLKDWKKDE